MEDDFLLPDNETPRQSNRRFLLIAIFLLAAFILFSLCIIPLLVVEKQETLIALLSTQNTSPPAAPLLAVPSIERPVPASSPSAVGPVEESTVQKAAAADVPKGTHRIIEYRDLRVPAIILRTPIPRRPHRIIAYGKIFGEDSSALANETPGSSE